MCLDILRKNIQCRHHYNQNEGHFHHYSKMPTCPVKFEFQKISMSHAMLETWLKKVHILLEIQI